jgi:asparagine synthase (glutamine-hydrolysing)
MLPFLDRRIADFALSLPAGWLRSDGSSKALLREAGCGVVPDAVLARRDKVGFEPPQAAWLREPGFRALIGAVLLDPAAAARGLYDGQAIEADLAAGAWRVPAGIWHALNAELWLRELVEAPLPEPVGGPRRETPRPPGGYRAAAATPPGRSGTGTRPSRTCRATAWGS